MIMQRPMFMAFAALAGVGLIAGFVGCGEQSGSQSAQANEEHSHEPAIQVDELVAVLEPTEGNEAAGVVTFTAENGEIRATGEFTGLEPDSEHAIHIHEFGDIRAADGTSAGGHYNPAGHEHGLPDQEQRHAGDLGNLQADGDGNAEFDITVSNATLAGPENPIIGRGMIIHAGTDDGSQPTGGAGARIAKGVIGVANPEVE